MLPKACVVGSEDLFGVDDQTKGNTTIDFSSIYNYVNNNNSVLPCTVCVTYQ
jgi:hypothetical protein